MANVARGFHFSYLATISGKQLGVRISVFPANIYLFKDNNRNSRKRCEICSKLTIKTLSNIFHTFFYCLYCWLWTSKCLLGDLLRTTLNCRVVQQFQLELKLVQYILTLKNLISIVPQTILQNTSSFSPQPLWTNKI